MADPKTWVDFAIALIAPVGVLAGAGVTSALTWRRELRKEEQQRARDRSYLAVLVSAHLEKFARDCCTSAWETGDPQDPDEEYGPMTRPELVDLLQLKVEWRSLSSDLMYDILNLPEELAQGRRRTSAIYSWHDEVSRELFWSHREEHSAIGTRALNLADRLRNEGGLPSRTDDPTNGSNLVHSLWEGGDRARKLREAWEAKQTKARAAGEEDPVI